MNKGPLILLTGATGAVGPRVVHALNCAGFRLRAFSLDAPKAGMFPPYVEVVIGDVVNEADIVSAMQGVDAVVHMAALLHIVNPPPEMREKYVRVNVGGTAAVVDAAIKAGVQRVVLFSTIAVYGASGGRVLDEMSPTCPDTFYGQTKLDAEKVALNARRTDGAPLTTVLRFGAIYGSRIKGNYERLTNVLSQKRFIPVGNGLNRRTLIYDKDVGRAVVQVVSHPAAAGRLYNVTDGGFHRMNEIIEAICLALGRKPPRFSLPVGPMRTVAGLLAKGAGVFGRKAPITRETIDKYTEDIAVDGSLFQKQLGFVPQYDLLAGWKDAVQEMKRSGDL
ncbi:MAG: NAD-dependent epimerase/dehydratase family protein [Syntrophaceae bacterium]|nr:NAD-dependent epimerase/dehydratase family protein [Syntrophaceae bacterium]